MTRYGLRNALDTCSDSTVSILGASADLPATLFLFPLFHLFLPSQSLFLFFLLFHQIPLHG